jgi:hypothetical protein
MSLEEKFNALSLGDEASICDTIKAEGVEKSGFAASIDVLVAKCDSSDDDESIAALATALALAEGCPEAEAFTQKCLTSCKFASLVSHYRFRHQCGVFSFVTVRGIHQVPHQESHTSILYCQWMIDGWSASSSRGAD